MVNNAELFALCNAGDTFSKYSNPVENNFHQFGYVSHTLKCVWFPYKFKKKQKKLLDCIEVFHVWNNLFGAMKSRYFTIWRVGREMWKK